MADMTPEERRQMRDVLHERPFTGGDHSLSLTEAELERRAQQQRQDDYESPENEGPTLGG